MFGAGVTCNKSFILCLYGHGDCARIDQRKQIYIIVCYPTASVKYPIFDFKRFSDFPLQESLQFPAVVVDPGLGQFIVVFTLVNIRIAIFFCKNDQQLSVVAQAQARLGKREAPGSGRGLRGIFGPVLGQFFDFFREGRGEFLPDTC